MLAKNNNIPILMRMESNLTSTKKGLLKDNFIKFLLKNSTYLLYISSDNKDYYKYYGVSDDKLIFCPYAVNNEYFQLKAVKYKDKAIEEKLRLGFKKNTIILLYASKLQKRKNPLDLLKAYKDLEKNYDVGLIYVGTGEEEDKLKKYIKNNNLKNVRLLGFKNQDVLPLYYQMCDIFVLPSSKEPFGMVIPEVLNFAKPVITTNEVGSARDLIKNGQNGFIVFPHDIKDLKNKIKLLIENKDLREKFGIESLKIINHWSYKEDINGILKALENIKR
jgi:glycosyltransferase involved in cell wall biosynthesis